MLGAGCRRVLTCLAGHTPCRKIVSRNEPYVVAETSVRKCSSSSCSLDSSLLFGTVHCYYYDTGYGFIVSSAPSFCTWNPNCAIPKINAHTSLERGGRLQVVYFWGGSRFRSESTATRFMCASKPQQPNNPLSSHAVPFSLWCHLSTLSSYSRHKYASELILKHPLQMIYTCMYYTVRAPTSNLFKNNSQKDIKLKLKKIKQTKHSVSCIWQ